MKREIDDLLRKCVAQGCTYTQDTGRHIKVYCPNGALVTIGSTPSDPRAWRNARARLRRVGGLDL